MNKYNNVYLSQNGNNLYADSWSSTSSTEISAVFSTSIGVNTGSWDLIVEDTQFGPITLSNGITINSSPPIINYLTPQTASPGESLPVTISGYNTSFIDWSGTNASFYFQSSGNTIYPDYTNVITKYIILGNITIPNDSSYIESYDLIVNDPVHGSIILNDALNINDFESYSINFTTCNGYLSISDESGNLILNEYNNWCDPQSFSVTLISDQCYTIDISNIDWYAYYSLYNSNGEIVSQASYHQEDCMSWYDNCYWYGDNCGEPCPYNGQFTFYRKCNTASIRMHRLKC